MSDKVGEAPAASSLGSGASTGGGQGQEGLLLAKALCGFSLPMTAQHGEVMGWGAAAQGKAQASQVRPGNDSWAHQRGAGAG